MRFSSAEHSGFNAIMSAVTRIVQAALSPDRPRLPHDNSDHVTSPPIGAELEPVLAHLMRFDTIFLVDDSGSMFGPRWAQARGALAAVVDLAVKYDKDGVDIRFFNDEDHRGDNLTSSTDVMDLFDKVIPNGVTPTEDAMEQELGDYMVKWKKQRRKTKKLNLIVLTDGEPDEDNHVDQMIVQYAKELDREGASKNQVGIQFVQIGDDAKATIFLKMLDNDLKRRYGIERDVRPFRFPGWLSARLTGARWWIQYHGIRISSRVESCTKRSCWEVSWQGLTMRRRRRDSMLQASGSDRKWCLCLRII